MGHVILSKSYIFEVAFVFITDIVYSRLVLVDQLSEDELFLYENRLLEKISVTEEPFGLL